MSQVTATLIAAATLLLVACNGGGDEGARDDGAGSTATELPTGSQVTATPTVTPTPRLAGARSLYLALGDSLSAGIGASNQVSLGWVGLVNAALPGWDLLNLGVAGDDSGELLFGGPLDEGLRQIELRTADDEPGNEVGAITLEIGGNNLLDIYFDFVLPGDCPSVVEALQRDFCVNALGSALEAYRTDLAEILSRVVSSAPDTPIFLMTFYNPFSGGSSSIDEIGVLALEGNEGTPFPEGLNDIIREAGAAAGVTVVEWYEPFLGKQSEYIAFDLIHPNDAGHAVLAEAVIESMALAGLPVVD
ncbi:MAG TPA: GDSL-type esterase/lipase family protein [Dehalococcoidia bacterium]